MRSLQAPNGKGKASAPGQLSKKQGGGATTTGKGKGAGGKACVTSSGCLSCNPGGRCKQCDTANQYGLQGTRCVKCTDTATMTLTAKGRCECK